jgi:hypothetical protein
MFFALRLLIFPGAARIGVRARRQLCGLQPVPLVFCC